VDSTDGTEETPDQLISQITFEGSPQLQAKLKALVREFIDVFATMLIKSLHQELAGQEAELDDDDDDPLLYHLRRECEKRIKDCEERLKQSQAEGEIQSILIVKIKHDLRDAQGEVPLPHPWRR